MMRINRAFKRFSIGAIALWLVLFALVPFLLVFVCSFFLQGEEHLFRVTFTFLNYFDLFHSIYFYIFVHSFYLAAITAFLCLILGYPFAYIVARIDEHFRPVLIFLIIIPFWTSSLIRTYALIMIIQVHGLLNHLLLFLGLIHQPLQILYTVPATLIGLIYALLPFMILPIYANLEKFDWDLLDAAKDLGASQLRTLSKIVIPLSMPGIIAGIMLVLLPAMTMFFIPDILGGAKSALLGNLVKDQFIEAHNWPLGSAVSIILTVLMGLLLLLYWKTTDSEDRQELL